MPSFFSNVVRVLWTSMYLDSLCEALDCRLCRSWSSVWLFCSIWLMLLVRSVICCFSFISSCFCNAIQNLIHSTKSVRTRRNTSHDAAFGPVQPKLAGFKMTLRFPYTHVVLVDFIDLAPQFIVGLTEFRLARFVLLLRSPVFLHLHLQLLHWRNIAGPIGILNNDTQFVCEEQWQRSWWELSTYSASLMVKASFRRLFSSLSRWRETRSSFTVACTCTKKRTI